MKTIYWIDDNISQLKIVAENVFCDLWQNSVNNKIILIGDDYKNIETGSTISQKQVDNLDEPPSEETKAFVEKQFENCGNTVDYVLTHTCPYNYMRIEMFICETDSSKVDYSTEN
ncbi:MAG: hypothetical protein LBM93_13605 [Oscillospiraceae bacterium]|jgi:hypothetical protein|nr:hypothetical protein [Oscillospiraceae bacterium]